MQHDIIALLSPFQDNGRSINVKQRAGTLHHPFWQNPSCIRKDGAVSSCLWTNSSSFRKHAPLFLHIFRWFVLIYYIVLINTLLKRLLARFVHTTWIAYSCGMDACISMQFNSCRGSFCTKKWTRYHLLQSIKLNTPSHLSCDGS